MVPDLSLPLTQPAYVFVVLFCVILLAPLAAERARLPGVVGLVVAGVLVGPGALGLVERSGALEVLGSVGLLYLMFLAGLDLDLEGFRQHRRDSVVFGASTFVVPMVVNTVAGLALGLSWPATLLIASAFTSHTLVAYPILQRFGLGRNRAVVATVGATLPSVAGALLVLAIIAGVHTGEVEGWAWALFAATLSAFFVVTLWGLPRLTRWFFSGLGQDRAVRFTFVLVALFAVAALADLAGTEPIVGAFVAGLALNRFVPEGSVLMERVRFLGASVLIPLFLVSTGMLIDPAGLVAEPFGLLAGGVFLVSALAGKWLAAWPAARLLRFDRAELGVMFALSAAQAAGTLAATIVGVEIGLIDDQLVNAVVIVILGTCVLASASAGRWAPRVVPPQRRPAHLGETVVVPIANPASAAPLVKLAALVAGPDSGSVVPVNILSFEASPEEVERHRAITADAEAVALRHGAEARSGIRIDASPTAGVLHTVVETGATCVMLGWKGYANTRENFFGGVIDTVLSRLRVPALVCRTGEDDVIRRVVLAVTPGDLTPPGAPALELAMEVCGRLARQADVPLLVLSEAPDARIDGLLALVRKSSLLVEERKPAIALRALATPGDVIVVGTPPTHAGLGQNASRLAGAVPGRTVIAAVARLS